MIVALVVDEDEATMPIYVREQKECVPGTDLYMCHDEMWGCWTYIAEDQDQLDAFVASLNAERELDNEDE